jgi:hypothetical protein
MTYWWARLPELWNRARAPCLRVGSWVKVRIPDEANQRSGVMSIKIPG